MIHLLSERQIMSGKVLLLSRIGDVSLNLYYPLLLDNTLDTLLNFTHVSSY